MTIAINPVEIDHHRWSALLGEAGAALAAEAKAAMRPSEFRRLWRKAHAALRVHGYGEGHQEGAARALRVAFPEYAQWIPARLERYDDTLPRELEAVLQRPERLTVEADPAPLAVDGDTEVNECEHEGHPWHCIRCNGPHENDCYNDNGFYHNFECGECGNERETCIGCDAERECDHLWRCDGCDEVEPNQGAW